MGTQLNIKDEETTRLARQAAARKGISMTAALREALQRDERDHEAEIARRIREVDAIVAEFQQLMPDDWRGKTSKEIMDAVYDDAEPDGFAR